MSNSPPTFSNNITKYPNGTAYDTALTYGFQINATDIDGNMANATFESNFTSTFANFTYSTTPNVQNTTKDIFWINFTQPQFKGAGTYQYRWILNDTGNAVNVTEWVYYTVNKAAMDVQPAPLTQAITYGTLLNQNCTTNSTIHKCSLWRGTSSPPAVNITTLNNTAEALTAGTWYFNATVEGSENYTSATSAVQTITVNKKAFTFTLLPSTQTITYETLLTQYAASNDTAANSQLTLWRNAVNVTVTHNGTSEALTAGTWTFWANSSLPGANYSYTNQTSTVTVNKKAFTFGLLPTAQTIMYGTSLLQRAISNDTTTASRLTLYMNDTNITASNNTNIVLGAGVYKYWANSTLDNVNNSFSNLTETLTINKAYAPLYSSQGVNSSNATTGGGIVISTKWLVLRNVTPTNLNLSTYTFSWNDSGTWANDTGVMFTDVNNSWSNVSKSVNKSREGQHVGWRIYANHTGASENYTVWNVTNVSTFFVNSENPAISAVSYLPSCIETGGAIVWAWTQQDNNALASSNCEFTYGSNTYVVPSTTAGLGIAQCSYVLTGTGIWSTKIVITDMAGNAASASYTNEVKAAGLCGGLAPAGPGAGGGGGGGIEVVEVQVEVPVCGYGYVYNTGTKSCDIVSVPTPASDFESWLVSPFNWIDLPYCTGEVVQDVPAVACTSMKVGITPVHAILGLGLAGYVYTGSKRNNIIRSMVHSSPSRRTTSSPGRRTKVS